MFSFLLVLLMIVALFMTILILLQKSDGNGFTGASAASMFGGAMTGSAAGTFLTRATAWLATIFFILCAALALVSSKTNIAQQQSDLRQELVTGDAPAGAVVSADTDASVTVTEVSENTTQSDAVVDDNPAKE